MALSRCLKCSTLFAVGLPHCPQCTSTRCVMEEEDMSPKTTVDGGPSNADGGENSWDGNSSSASTDPQPTSDSSSSLSDQSPAPTTELPSSPDQTESGTAPSTDGETSTDPYDGWTKEDLQAELADRELPVSGNKPELLARLREHDAKVDEDQVDDETENDNN